MYSSSGTILWANGIKANVKSKIRIPLADMLLLLYSLTFTVTYSSFHIFFIADLIMQVNGDLVEYDQEDNGVWKACANSPDKHVCLALTNNNALALYDLTCTALWQATLGSVHGGGTCSY